MEVRRTVRVKLEVNSESAALLHETVNDFLWAANFVVDHAWEGEYKTTCKTKLQRETYDDVRAETRLNSALVQNARNKAANAIQSTVARWKQDQYAGKPRFSKPTVTYDKRCATFTEKYATLATTKRRVKVEYILPDEGNDTPHAHYLLNDKYEVTGAELLFRDDDWYLHVRTKADIEQKDPEQTTTGHNTVLGVDLGVENIAVTSTGVFWAADELNHWHREYENRRKSLQIVETRWAHRNMESVGRQEAGRFKMMLHQIANELITEALDKGCSVIAFEDLTGIRDRLSHASWGHIWPYRRLYEYVKYKARVMGIIVEQVDPKNTSQKCSTCGFIDPDNRPSQPTFCCLNCGYENHADYNAAKNIGLRYLRRNQTGGGGGAPLGVRLNSGMLNANGDYIPPSNEGRAGVHAETHVYNSG